MQIRLYNSSNNNHIALRFVEVETEQLVMPFMVGDDGEPEMHYQILQKIGSTETLVAQGFYADGPFRLSNLVVDGSSLKLYVNGVLWRTISITAMTVNRLELSGGAKRLLVDEMFVMPGIASKEDIESWYGLDQPFYDPNGVLQDKQIASSERWDQKARTFYQATAPTATAVGDLWVDTDDNNHLYRWSGTAWVDVQDKSPIPDERIPSAENWDRKARTFYQGTPPAASGVGDIWFDTSDHNHRYWWDGAKWADVSDTSPVNASQRPIHAQGLGGDIYFDQHGYRAVRKADGKIMMHFDLETGSNYWEGDGVFRGRVEASEGYFHGRVEAEEGYFRGDITGATGTFAGDLSAEGVVSYGNLNINYARVTSIVIPAPGWNHASLQIAQNKDEWNTGSWLGTFTWDETTSAPKIYTQTITITHQELSTLIGGGIIQYSPDGVNWSSEILLEALSFETPSVFLNVGGHPLAVGLISSSMSSHPSITTSQLRIRVFHLYGTEIDPPESFHIRVKRHAIG